MDSFEGECEHRQVKRFYPRVSKAKFTAGIAKQQRRERLLFKMAEASPYGKKGRDKQVSGKQKGKVLQLSSPDAPALHFEDSEPLPYSDPQSHYHISTGTRYPVNIYKWLRQHVSDPAFNVSCLICAELKPTNDLQELSTSTKRPSSFPPARTRI